MTRQLLSALVFIWIGAALAFSQKSPEQTERLIDAASQVPPATLFGKAGTMSVTPEVADLTEAGPGNPLSLHFSEPNFQIV